MIRLPGNVLPGAATVLGSIIISAADSRRPNLVILADNQGAWTLGSYYGNPDVRTPHIDRLAAEGIGFTRASSSNPACSPTRAAFLTGLFPSQHGVRSIVDPKYDIWNGGRSKAKRHTE